MTGKTRSECGNWPAGQTGRLAPCAGGQISTGQCLEWRLEVETGGGERGNRDRQLNRKFAPFSTKTAWDGEESKGWLRGSQQLQRGDTMDGVRGFDMYSGPGGKSEMTRRWLREFRFIVVVDKQLLRWNQSLLIQATRSARCRRSRYRISAPTIAWGGGHQRTRFGRHRSPGVRADSNSDC